MSQHNKNNQQPQEQAYRGPIPNQACTSANLRDQQLGELGGNWQRLKYDYGNYARDLEQSTRLISDFTLDPTSIHRCHPCRPEEIGYIGSFGVSYDHTRPLTDTESDLRNLTRPATRDPNLKYQPCCPELGSKKDDCGMPACQEGYPCGGGVVPGCEEGQPKLFHFPSCGLRREFSRISNPTCTLRETGLNRFQPTYLDHQDPTRWELQGETGINYRLVAKDNHVPCIPRPIDQTPALPRPRPLPCQPIIPTCANPVLPLHNHYKGTSTTCVPRK